MISACYWHHVRTANFVASLLMSLSLATFCSGMVVVDIIPTSDQEFHDRFHDGTFDDSFSPTNPVLSTTSFDNPSQVGIDARPVMEFDLTSARALGRELISASFISYVQGTSTPSGFTQLSFDLHGFAGNGIAEAADASLVGNQIGQLTITAGFPGFGRHEIPVDFDFVASSLAGNNFLGIVTRSDLNTGGISIGSSERSLDELNGRGPPTLRLVFVPEPGSITLLFAVAVWLVGVGTRRLTH